MFRERIAGLSPVASGSSLDDDDHDDGGSFGTAWYESLGSGGDLGGDRGTVGNCAVGCLTHASGCDALRDGLVLLSQDDVEVVVNDLEHEARAIALVYCWLGALGGALLIVTVFVGYAVGGPMIALAGFLSFVLFAVVGLPAAIRRTFSDPDTYIR